MYAINNFYLFNHIMKKLYLLAALLLASAIGFAASITVSPSTVDFGSVSIKGQSLPVTGTTSVTVTWSGLTNQGATMYAEISQGALDDDTNPNGFYVANPDYVYLDYGDKMVSSCQFSIGYSVKAAGSYSGKLHLYSYDTNWNDVHQYANITITVTDDAIVAKTTPFVRVNTTSELKEGDVVVFVSENAAAVSGQLNGAYLTAITDGVKVDKANGKADVPEDAQTFLMHKYSGNWQFLYPDDNEKALLLDYASNSGKGAFDTTYLAGSTVKTWEISISNGVATVIRPNEADPDYPVRFNSDRFKPYKTESTGTDIALYKKAGEAQEIQSKLEIGAINFGDVEQDEQTEVTVNYTAENLTDDIIWAVEGTDAALFDVADQGSRTSGTVTLTYKGTSNKTGALDARLSYLTQDAKLDPMEGSVTIGINLIPATIKLTKIEFKNAPATIDQGQTIDMSQYVVYTPDNAAVKTLTWTTDHDYQGTIDADGKLTAKRVSGNVIVTATSVRVPSVTASVTLKITVPTITDFTLSDSELTLGVGESKDLTVTAFVPDYASATASYTSSNSDVVTVSKGGKMTAKALGNADVTVTIGEIQKTCAVHVVATGVESITFEPAEANLTKGSTLQLNPVITPAQAALDNAITYTSANPEVATVSETGLVKGIAAGDAVVTATCDGKSAQIAIHVIEPAMFAKVVDAATLGAGDTIILATVANDGVIAGARDSKKFTVLTGDVIVTDSEAYADNAVRLVLGTEKGKDGFTLTIVGGKTIAVTSSGNDIVDANTQNCKFWEFVADGSNGYYVHNLGNTYAYFKYHAGNAAIKPYKASTVGATYVYAYVRKYIAPVVTGLDAANSAMPVQKVFRNGQLLIICNGVTYTVTGLVEVR